MNVNVAISCIGTTMTFSVVVHSAAGQFEASLVGAPDVSATAATREDALAKLESAISKRLDQGELVQLEIRRRGLAGLFGKFRDDPTLRDICEDAYKERDAELQK
jgi:predicted RNase H-like HicB family nuclease